MSSSSGVKERPSQDLVAIFHASFHPTKGHIVDWSLKASEDLNLDGVEFSALPSGLHLVEQDVVYFTKGIHHGMCVFRRRATTEHGHRGFRLSSLGVLLAPSLRPRPWRHVVALKRLVSTIYSSLENGDILEPTEGTWEPARTFFEERKVRRADLGGAGDWKGWDYELDGPDADPPESNPTLHLPHLLRILGPSALTLYKHILGRRRILIYTLPPVEAACILCQVAADMCYETQIGYQQVSIVPEDEDVGASQVKGKCKEGLNVLGMITLSDLSKLQDEDQSGRGWIACTTDAIFLEKPSYYDLVIDLTTSTPFKSSRPTLSISRSTTALGSKTPKYRLSTVRFTWSDIKLWNELERLLQRDAGGHAEHSCCAPTSATSDGRPRPAAPWSDAWRIYEDVCLICASLWVGGWRQNSHASYSTGNGGIENWGRVQLEGDDDLSVDAYFHTVGDGIEGRPVDYGPGAGVASGKAPVTRRAMRRTSGMSWSSAKSSAAGGGIRFASSSSAATPDTHADLEMELNDRRERQVLITLALLQTFAANTHFQLSHLASLLAASLTTEPEPAPGPQDGTDALDALHAPPPPQLPPGSAEPLVLSSRDVLSFELGPLSALDARFLEWLGDEYGGGRRVVVKSGWKDFFGMLLGLS